MRHGSSILAAGAMSTVLAAALVAGAQQSTGPHRHEDGREPGSAAGGPECQRMAARWETARNEQETAAAKLDELVVRLDAAEAPARMDALAALAKELVVQHQRLVAQFQYGQRTMMAHVMRHIESAMHDGASASAEACPMMRSPAQR